MVNALRYGLFCLVAALLAQQVAWAAEPVAMVTDVKGAVTVSKQNTADKLQLLDYLLRGAEIQLAKDAKLTITYFTSPREFAFSGPATVSVGNDAPRVTKGPPIEVRNIGQENSGAAKKFSAMQRQRLAQATFEMRAAAPGVRLVGPVETAVLSATPEFTWFGPSDAVGYRFVLSDGTGKEVQSFDVGSTSWRVPDAQPLARGGSYRWKVETTLHSGETLSAAGRFTVINAERAREISAARPRQDAAFSERVLYAARLEAEGLKYEANAEWQVLAKERPDDPVLREMSAR